ncbi:MAG: hypothetical protein EPN22_08015 [Nitrospirae bacterium]|nr:MAG: hypothetical protein EPN22_08015 [Nitrospirota bacterium]
MQSESTEKIIYAIEETLLKTETAFDKNLGNAAVSLAEAFGVSRCSIMSVNSGEQTLEVLASTKEELVGCKRKLSDVTISTRALLDNTPLKTNPETLSFFQPLDSSRFSCPYSINIPFSYLDKKLGVFILSDPKDGNPLSAEQEVSAIRVTRHIAPYIYAVQSKELIESKVAKCEQTTKHMLELDALKTDLANFIVHDLKGPISTIMANLDMLSYEELTPLQLEYLNIAMSDIYKLQRMVMNILDVSKLEDGKIKIYRDEVDVYDLVKRETASCKNSLSQKNIQLKLEGGPHICYIDESLIGRVLANLLFNAIDYSPEEAELAVSLRYDDALHEVLISISDHGTGVQDEFKEKIFDKFFQVHSEASQRKATTGLGLTFCKLVVTAHGGRIWVEDAPGGGAAFKFTLPERLQEGPA